MERIDKLMLTNSTDKYYMSNLKENTRGQIPPAPPILIKPLYLGAFCFLAHS